MQIVAISISIGASRALMILARCAAPRPVGRPPRRGAGHGRERAAETGRRRKRPGRRTGPPRGGRGVARQGEDGREVFGRRPPGDRDPGPCQRPAGEGRVRQARRGLRHDLRDGQAAARTLGGIAKALARADGLVLATDPDREGEAIAWQVLEWLKERDALEGRPVFRAAFHEVTPGAVRAALDKPRGLDMELVRAWQARRALDYLVGYGLSPLLWRKLPGCRSAGRVQSVALRLLCEREAEIEAFAPRRYWTVAVELATPNGARFPATLRRLDGAAVGEAGFATEAAAEDAAARIRRSAFSVASVARDVLRRPPRPPFNTATLQREAESRLGSAWARPWRSPSASTRAWTSAARGPGWSPTSVPAPA